MFYRCPDWTSWSGSFQAHVAEDVVMVYRDFLHWQNLSCSVVQRKEVFLKCSFFVWWMSCAYNGRALPLQIKQTWHCPALETSGTPQRQDQRPCASLDFICARHAQQAKEQLSSSLIYVVLLSWARFKSYWHEPTSFQLPLSVLLFTHA